VDSETDLEAFSNDICDSAWGATSLDADAGASCVHDQPTCFSFRSSTAGESGIAGGVMSPVRGLASSSRSFGRGLSVNVDVDESSGSDWDNDSGTAEDGEVLVSCFAFCPMSVFHSCGFRFVDC
jgi:hypothetical protein